MAAIGRISGSEAGLEFEQLLRKTLTLLVPAPADDGSRAAENKAAA